MKLISQAGSTNDGEVEPPCHGFVQPVSRDVSPCLCQTTIWGLFTYCSLSSGGGLRCLGLWSFHVTRLCLHSDGNLSDVWSSEARRQPCRYARFVLQTEVAEVCCGHYQPPLAAVPSSLSPLRSPVWPELVENYNRCFLRSKHKILR